MWSADPVARMTSLWGLKAMQLTSAVCTSEAAAGPAQRSGSEIVGRQSLSRACKMSGWPLMVVSNVLQ